MAPCSYQCHLSKWRRYFLMTVWLILMFAMQCKYCSSCFCTLNQLNREASTCFIWNIRKCSSLYLFHIILTDIFRSKSPSAVHSIILFSYLLYTLGIHSFTSQEKADLAKLYEIEVNYFHQFMVLLRRCFLCVIRNRVSE